MFTEKDASRFFEKLTFEPNSGCWLWMGATVRGGYGQFTASKEHLAAGGKKHVYAHRFIYEWTLGPIPDGLTIDHKCRVRCCVNPDHLEAVPFLENIRRRPIGLKTHCAKGHPLDGDNILHVHRSDGCEVRVCRICARNRVAKFRRKSELGIVLPRPEDAR